MPKLPHEALPSSKKRHVFLICDRFWFRHRRKPTRSEVRAAYGSTESSLNSIDWYLSAWWKLMKVERFANV